MRESKGEGEGESESEGEKNSERHQPRRLESLKRQLYDIGYRIDKAGSMWYILQTFGDHDITDVSGRLSIEGGACAPLSHDTGDPEAAPIQDTCGQPGDVHFYLC